MSKTLLARELFYSGKKEKALRLMTEVDLYIVQRQAKENQPDKT